MNMEFFRKLPIPKDIKEQYPLSDQLAGYKAKEDKEIKAILGGESGKFLLIIGPCSADREDSVLDYISRLRKVQEKVSDKIVIVPRLYTNKPRTTGDGYKGMLHQPDPEAKPDMLKGITATRSLYIKVLKETGFSCANEMLYPENHRYLSDVLSYAAVGARSVENQEHRLCASGLDIPCGMKNPTGGDLNIMLNAIETAQHSHTFIYRGWEVKSQGNPYAHAVLRGYADKHGVMYPNYRYDDLLELCGEYSKRELHNKAVIVDCNHANSGKRYSEQIGIACDVMQSRQMSEDIRKTVKGLMIESYIEDGAQNIGDNIYGKSITDACLGWEKTETLIYNLADKL